MDVKKDMDEQAIILYRVHDLQQTMTTTNSEGKEESGYTRATPRQVSMHDGELQLHICALADALALHLVHCLDDVVRAAVLDL